MSSQVTNYKCPACTGPLHFAGDTGMLECDYCDSSYTVAEIEALFAEEEKAAAEAAASDPSSSSLTESWDLEKDDMKAYGCPSCGAEIICDIHTAATSCPYCGNPTVIPSQFEGVLKPDYIIPFKLEKEQAIAALKKHYNGKRLLPKAFSDENHLEELKGIYVPFWLFDGSADADITYTATLSSVRRAGDYRITTTRHFRVRRAGEINFAKIPVDASSKMPDDYMDSLEPYHYEDLKSFSTAYLPGFFADKYDVTVKESQDRVHLRCQNTAEDAIRSTVIGYNTCIPLSKDIKITQGNIRYALLPVWLLTTKWNNKTFLFAINGQTGKMVGNLPVSWKAFWLWFLKIAAPLTAVLTLILYVL